MFLLLTKPGGICVGLGCCGHCVKCRARRVVEDMVMGSCRGITSYTHIFNKVSIRAQTGGTVMEMRV